MARLRGHPVYIALVIVLAVFLIKNGIGFYKVQYPGDATSQFFSNELVARESFLNGVMPLWNPLIMSGTPLLAKAQSTVLSVYTLMQVVSPTPYLATTLTAFIHLILLGGGVYWLSVIMGIKKRYAFISVAVCQLSAYVSVGVFFDIFQLMGLTFFVYAIIFTIKGLKSRGWIGYAILSGAFISMEFHSGAFEIFTFSFWVILYILLFNLLGKPFKQRLIKSVIFGIVFLTAAVGLASIKLLPATELANMSQRQEPFDFERSIGAHVGLQNAFSILVDERNLPNFTEHAVKGTSSLSIGIIAALLVLISLFYFKKKRYLFFLGMALLGILMITKSPWNYLLWKFFPYFNRQKHVLKAGFVFLTAASVLAAYGAQYLISRIKDKRFARIGYIALLVVVVLTSWGFTYDMKMKDSRAELDGIGVMKYMAEDDGVFRFKAWETNGIDWGTNYYSVIYGLQDIYGYENLWLTDYLPVFLSVANREPAKFFGIMNMKYMTSMDSLNISGFKLVKKFDDSLSECKYINGEIADFNGMEQCPGYEALEKAWGPYLYLNEKFLPRAYFVDNSVLVVGSGDSQMQIVYGLMLDGRFNPSNTAIFVGKESVNDYDVGELRRYDAVFITPGSIDESSSFILNDYVSNGGMLLPNVIKGESSLNDEMIGKMFGSFEGELNAVDYITHNYNKYSVKLDRTGFLVLSEKFSMFPGWRAYGDGKELSIEKVDGVISAVYVDKPYDKVVFEYKPKSYIRGRNITVLTLLLVIGYFGYRFYIKKKKTANTKKNND